MPVYMWDALTSAYRNLKTGEPLSTFITGVTLPVPGVNVGPRYTPSGTTYNSDVTLTTSQVFSNNRVFGRVKVPLSATGNIIIEDNYVNAVGSATSGPIIDVHVNTNANVLIRFNEICGTVGQLGIGVRRFTAYRNYIHHVEDGLRIHNFGGTGVAASNVIAEANFIGPLISQTPDPNDANRTDKKNHNDGIQIEGADGTVLRGNAIYAMATTDGTSNTEWARSISPYDALPAGTSGARERPQASNGIIITPNVSPVTNLLVENNWIYGGERGFNAGNNGNSTTTALVKGNRFDRQQWFTDNARVINIDVSDNTAPYRIVLEDNVYMDDGTAVPFGRTG